LSGVRKKDEPAVFVRVFGESSAAGWRRVSERRVCAGGRGDAYEVVRADVDPRDEVRLRHVLAVEELVEVLGGVSGARGRDARGRRTTMGLPGRFMLNMLLELGSVSLRTETARL
jgi:hypothetical protein